MRLIALLVGVLLLAGCSASSAAPTPLTAAGSTPTPVAVSIPAIRATSTLVPLGLDNTGAMVVPPVDQPMQAGYYKFGPLPGAQGPAVVVGHVDGRINGRGGQPGIFHRLRELKPGDRINIDRVDGSRVTFRVERVETHPKSAFPTAAVYGDTPGPALRLITCGSSFDRAARSYRGNVIVFAVPT